MRIFQNYFFFLLVFLTLNTFAQRKIKRIDYHVFGYIKNEDSIKNLLSQNKHYKYSEHYDINGNLIKKNEYDKNMLENYVVEYSYNKMKQIISESHYTNYHNEPRKRTHHSKFLYRNNLLDKQIHYYGTSDTTPPIGNTTYTYDSLKRKIKIESKVIRDEVLERNISEFYWINLNSYYEHRINELNHLNERQYVLLDNRGRKIMQKINRELKSDSDTSFFYVYDLTYDKKDNLVKMVETSPVKKNFKIINIYTYKYNKSTWVMKKWVKNGIGQETIIKEFFYY